MADSKLEPRLQAFLAEDQARIDAGASRSLEVEAGIPVTISLNERVLARTDRSPESEVRVLEERTTVSQRPVLRELEKMGAPERIVHRLTNAITTRLQRAQLAAVAQLDEVKLIRLEAMEMVTCMHQSPAVIELNDAIADFGADGRGIRVAILDSGVDPNHPALVGKVIDQFDTTGTGLAPGSHGTHVAGTVASNDPVNRGVAPQADLINIKVLTSAGAGAPANVITGLDQALRRGALVANLSLGWSEFAHGWVCNDADCILCEAADNASRLGMTVVVAAGNEGAGAGRIRHPGAARRVITVGAVDKSKVLAGFSSRGPSSGRVSPGAATRLTKPDLCAPGVDIRSSIPPNGFASFNGTSMASPHVAGLAALILQRNRALSPRMVKKILEETCEPLPGLPNEVGYGLVNAYGALMRANAGATLAAHS